MKKFHKRAAVFLTAATLAGLPAGAFFYSSPGSLTVWADNVEVESSEESSPEDVSDGSEAEILADPVEQAQEDAGNDVTETPEVGITFTEPEGWQTDTATVKIQVEDTKNTGAFSIAKVEARLSENGGWSDITGNMEVSISSNCSVYVRVTDQNGNTYEQNRYIECFDKTKPTIIAAAKNGILIVQGVDAESGIAALYVNGNEFTELTNNTLNVRLQKADTSYEYFTLQAKDKAGNMSEIYKVGNPYYENPDAVKENTEVSGTEQNAASLPVDGTASKPTSATATVTEHQTTNETATAPTEPENTGNETDTEADTGRVQGESSASGMTTGTVQDKGGKEFYTIKTKSDKVFYLIVDKDKTDENVYLKCDLDGNVKESFFTIAHKDNLRYSTDGKYIYGDNCVQVTRKDAEKQIITVYDLNMNEIDSYVPPEFENIVCNYINPQDNEYFIFESVDDNGERILAMADKSQLGSIGGETIKFTELCKLKWAEKKDSNYYVEGQARVE